MADPLHNLAKEAVTNINEDLLKGMRRRAGVGRGRILILCFSHAYVELDCAPFRGLHQLVHGISCYTTSISRLSYCTYLDQLLYHCNDIGLLEEPPTAASKGYDRTG